MPASLGYVRDGDWDTVRRNAGTTAQLLNPPVPQVRVFNNANISVANNTVTALTFNSERFDAGDLHSTSSNQGRLTAPITGLYVVGGQVRFAANASGRRDVFLRVNGSTQIAFASTPSPHASIDSYLAPVTLYQLTAADYVELCVFQNSGGALNAVFDAANSPEFWMVRLAGFVNQGV
jgi:hypothetical protein